MPQMVEWAEDFLRFNTDLVRAVAYAAFDPDTDTHATTVECSGVRSPARVSEEAGRVVTRRSWTLTGLDARPTLRSLVVDGGESWVVETVTPDPASETVWQVDTHKG